MKVLTKNPIVLDGSDISPKDYYSNAASDVSIDFDYLPTEQVSAGDVKVVTKYPIVLDGSDISPRDYYSNMSGPSLSTDALAFIQEQSKKTGKEPNKSQKEAAKQKGLFWDNVKNNWQSFSQSDAGKMALSQIDAALTARREARFGAGQGGAFFSTEQPSQQQQRPMSTTTKVLLIGGAVVVVGLILYSVLSSKGAAATAK
jgi:hypothetical protein